MTAPAYRIVDGTLYVPLSRHPAKLHAERLNMSSAIHIYPANNWARRLSRLLFSGANLRAALRIF